jgi:hypothetical protein
MGREGAEEVVVVDMRGRPRGRGAAEAEAEVEAEVEAEDDVGSVG